MNRDSVPIKVTWQNISLSGPIITTYMLAPRAAMRLENDYLSALRKVTRYRRDGERLQLRGDDGGFVAGMSSVNETPDRGCQIS